MHCEICMVPDKMQVFSFFIGTSLMVHLCKGLKSPNATKSNLNFPAMLLIIQVSRRLLHCYYHLNVFSVGLQDRKDETGMCKFCRSNTGMAGKKCTKCSSVCMYVLTLRSALKLFVSVDVS